MPATGGRFTRTARGALKRLEEPTTPAPGPDAADDSDQKEPSK